MSLSWPAFLGLCGMMTSVVLLFLYLMLLKYYEDEDMLLTEENKDRIRKKNRESINVLTDVNGNSTNTSTVKKKDPLNALFGMETGGGLPEESDEDSDCYLDENGNVITKKQKTKAYHSSMTTKTNKLVSKTNAVMENPTNSMQAAHNPDNLTSTKDISDPTIMTSKMDLNQSNFGKNITHTQAPPTPATTAPETRSNSASSLLNDNSITESSYTPLDSPGFSLMENQNESSLKFDTNNLKNMTNARNRRSNNNSTNSYSFPPNSEYDRQNMDMENLICEAQARLDAEERHSYMESLSCNDDSVNTGSLLKSSRNSSKSNPDVLERKHAILHEKFEALKRELNLQDDESLKIEGLKGDCSRVNESKQTIRTVLDGVSRSSSKQSSESINTESDFGSNINLGLDSRSSTKESVNYTKPKPLEWRMERGILEAEKKLESDAKEALEQLTKFFDYDATDWKNLIKYKDEKKKKSSTDLNSNNVDSSDTIGDSDSNKAEIDRGNLYGSLIALDKVFQNIENGPGGMAGMVTRRTIFANTLMQYSGMLEFLRQIEDDKDLDKSVVEIGKRISEATITTVWSF